MTEFRQMLEAALRDAEGGDPNKAPCGLDSAESFAWLSGRASALQWALEMLPPGQN